MQVADSYEIDEKVGSKDQQVLNIKLKVESQCRDRINIQSSLGKDVGKALRVFASHHIKEACGGLTNRNMKPQELKNALSW